MDVREKSLIDSLGGYQLIFNAIADATEVVCGFPHSAVGISVEAFAASIISSPEFEAFERRMFSPLGEGGMIDFPGLGIIQDPQGQSK